MSWGRVKTPPPPRSALSKLLPLIILFVLLIAITVFAYYIYVSVQKISKAANEKIQSKNVVFTKDGMRVGVKEVNTESYVGTTQSFLVKAWNLSTWPEYKSRFWNKEQQQAPENGKLHARHP
ncbi:hypothetical protein OIDMADRAFT_123081 [Oidiodendron maius Zn]|uniref:Uncharacterized protein n=1 Tax=Oidiodendron maius (strain Zn) TaxID=913774 RepID=A0A0C3GXN9_OIDMZ|nr:hypothetical protein OIDMADRAFT_123081 [Oidiodendron maius Zn]